ncbi:MAG: hypothetical protein JSS63_03025 [Bacteroidetes bacterium]|nr:hypothetical protein [Bacteroidota bacterium]MBX7047105.1 hypothetical protein [Ignavibacteria bacterium]
MTVINAIKFDKNTGAMCCDEQTTIGDVRRMMSSDKIQQIVPTSIRKALKLEVLYGGTGTTAIGDEVRKGMKLRITREYEELKNKTRERIEHLKTIDEIAQIGFEEMMKVKHRHVNDIIKGYFSFESKDFNQGFYNDRENKKIEISQKDVKDKVFGLINWKDAEEADGVFLNAAIVCGFDETGEFKIFKLNMKTDMTIDLVPSIFETVGSGSDASQIIFAAYSGVKTVSERRNKIDRVEGIIQLIRATNAAARFNMGVGGYFNIIYLDGTKDSPDERLIEVMDSKAKLASELVQAYYGNYISDNNAFEIIDELIYKRKKSFKEMNAAFLKASKNKNKMERFLRGYKVG